MEIHNMENAILQYDLFPHYYISNKDTYESIMCECLNKSEKMSNLYGGKFSRIVDQYNKQPDVISENSGYEIDFKMMISESLKEFQSRTAPIVQEIAPGVNTFHYPPQLKKKVLLILNCCKNIDENRLQHFRKQKDMEAKAVTHFFDKVINTNKNILLFIPVFFSTVDQSFSSKKQYEIILNEISTTTSYIYDYRFKNCNGFDTFIVYAVNISTKQEFNFIIAKFTSEGLEFIDKVQFFSLESVQKIAKKHL